MKLSKILKTLDDYNEVISEIHRTIIKLPQYDVEIYPTIRITSIENIKIADNYGGGRMWVNVEHNVEGDYDVHWFEFPLFFISLSDDALEKELMNKRITRINQYLK